jgi:hypothetical protein
LHITCNVAGSKKISEIDDSNIIMLKADSDSAHDLYIHPEIIPVPYVPQIVIESDYKPKDFKFIEKNNYQIYLLQNLKVDGQDISIWAKNNPDKIDVLEMRLRAITDAKLTGEVILEKGESQHKVKASSTEVKAQTSTQPDPEENLSTRPGGCS